MSPERRRWLAFVTACKSDLDALEEAGLARLGDADAIVLTREEKRDLGAMVSICAHAAVVCERVRWSLSNEAVEQSEDGSQESGESGDGEGTGVS